MINELRVAKELTFRKFLNVFEDLSFNAEGEWSKDDSGHDIKLFTVDDKKYRLRCVSTTEQSEELVYIDFSSVDASPGGSFARQNAGTSVKAVANVLATVANSTLDKFPNAEVFLFSADDAGRAKLYARVTQRFATIFRGSYRSLEKDGTTFFWAQRATSKLNPDDYAHKI